MGAQPAKTEMENDPKNPCIGCGPENPVGLHLRFQREEDGVSANLEAVPNFQGWPERLHSGVLYLALLETANWTVFALRGRVGLPIATSALTSKRWVAIGETLRMRGRPTDSNYETIQVRAEAWDSHDELVGYLDRDYELPSRSEFLRLMGYATIPAELDAMLPSD